VNFFEIECEAHSRGATIYVIGLFGEIVASRIERWIASLPDHIVNVRLDLVGVSYIDPVSFVRVARALTRWRDLRGTAGSRRVNMEFPERSRRRVALPPFAVGDPRSGSSAVARSRLEMQTARGSVPDGKHASE
jgi:hypothetical protein